MYIIYITVLSLYLLQHLTTYCPFKWKLSMMENASFWVIIHIFSAATGINVNSHWQHPHPPFTNVAQHKQLNHQSRPQPRGSSGVTEQRHLQMSFVTSMLQVCGVIIYIDGNAIKKQFQAPPGFICADPECSIFLTQAAGRFDVISLSKQWRAGCPCPACGRRGRRRLITVKPARARS